MRFKFRLTRLLELRDAEVERCEKALGVAIQATREATQDLERNQREQRQLDRAWAEAMKTSITGATLMDFNNERLKLMADSTLLNDALLLARQKEQDAKKELERALAKQKSLLKLQERARQKHEATERHHEQAQLDEFGVTSDSMTPRSPPVTHWSYLCSSVFIYGSISCQTGDSARSHLRQVKWNHR